MAPIRYSLHYEDYSDHLMSRFGKLLQMQSLVDMTLMCSSHTLRVHKVVLAASSAYFQEVLQKQNGEPLIILKMRFSVLKCLVEFMYCGKTQCLEENLDELVSAAQFLKIKGLSKVTKEGLGITNQTELPEFTPPVVINRPPKSLLDVQERTEVKNTTQSLVTNQSIDTANRAKDTVVRIPFDIEVGGGLPPARMDYANTRVKPRRGRPSTRRSGGWAPAGVLGKAAERALLRREQDSRKAIHHLKHLQNKQMQEYMDQVTLSEAVNSICGPESSSNHNYMNIESDLLYMDQSVSSNILDSTVHYSKDNVGHENITSSYSENGNAGSCSDMDTSSIGISTAMSQYVNALKKAGLPTDLPILFESGDGSYINVNEQVLLDMVQSSEIQYEVIEQPNIIEKVANPTEIKSIDELSKSIERGEMLINSKNYSVTGNYDKDSPEYIQHEEAINSLNAILPDNLESISEQQNYVVLNSIQENNNEMDHISTPDFSCIVNDMQFFTKNMNDDTKNYYEEQPPSIARTIEQMTCPTSTVLDTNFNMSFLDTKVSHFENEYNCLNSEDLRRNEDGYDFSLQLSQNHDFKDDALECLMSTTKPLDIDYNKNKTYSENNQLELNNSLEEISETVNDIENAGIILKQTKYNGDITSNNDDHENSVNIIDIKEKSNKSIDFNETLNRIRDEFSTKVKSNEEDLTDLNSDIQYDNVIVSDKTNFNPCNNSKNNDKDNDDSIIDELSFENHDQINLNEEKNKLHLDISKEMLSKVDNEDEVTSTFEDNIPFAVGLLPLSKVYSNDSIQKRKIVDDLNNEVNCLKSKVKCKKL